MGDLHFLLYAMMACQMAVWVFFSAKGGNLTDRAFLVFTAGMMMGQLGAGVETFWLRAWGAFAVQVFFFAFTAFGGVHRYRAMRSKS